MKLVTIAALVLMASVVQAQEKEFTVDEKFIGDKNFALHVGSMEAAKSRWLPNQQAVVGNKELVDAAALFAFFDINKLSTTNDQLVLQTMQNQRIIEQNDRIIALLEKLVQGK